MSLTHRGRISVMGQIHRIHNEMNGYSRQSTFKGLARSGTQGSDLRWLMTGRGFWTWTSLGAWGSECGATWKSDPSAAATRAADLTRSGGDYTAGRGGSRAWGPLGSRASNTTRRGTSSASNFLDRRNGAWSPANVLVDMVARMQQDLVDLRAENRLLRTPGFLR